MSDRIELALDGDEPLLVASREFERAIAGEVLATRFTIGTADAHAAEAAVDGMALRIALRKA